jgi:hypothetical protein
VFTTADTPARPPVSARGAAGEAPAPGFGAAGLKKLEIEPFFDRTSCEEAEAGGESRVSSSRARAGQWAAQRTAGLRGGRQALSSGAAVKLERV